MVSIYASIFITLSLDLAGLYVYPPRPRAHIESDVPAHTSRHHHLQSYIQAQPTA